MLKVHRSDIFLYWLENNIKTNGILEETDTEKKDKYWKYILSEIANSFNILSIKNFLKNIQLDDDSFTQF